MFGQCGHSGTWAKFFSSVNVERMPSQASLQRSVSIEMNKTWDYPQCVEVDRNVACSLIVDICYEVIGGEFWGSYMKKPRKDIFILDLEFCTKSKVRVKWKKSKQLEQRRRTKELCPFVLWMVIQAWSR